MGDTKSFSSWMKKNNKSGSFESWKKENQEELDSLAQSRADALKRLSEKANLNDKSRLATVKVDEPKENTSLYTLRTSATGVEVPNTSAGASAHIDNNLMKVADQRATNRTAASTAMSMIPESTLKKIKDMGDDTNTYEMQEGDSGMAEYRPIKNGKIYDILKSDGMTDEQAKWYQKNWENLQGIQDQEKKEKERTKLLSQYDEDTLQLMDEYLDLNAVINSYGVNGTIPSNGEWERQNEIRKEIEKKGISTEDWSKALEAYEYVKDERDTKQFQKMIKDEINDNVGNAIAWNAVDVLTSPISGLSATTDALINKAIGKDANPYSDAYLMQNMSEAVQEGTSEAIGEENVLGQFAYGVASSTAKAGLSMAIGGSVTSTLGLSGSAAGVVQDLVTLPSFGGSAYASTLKEDLDKGLGEDQAQAHAAATGIFEMLFEKVSLDKAYDIYKTSGSNGLKTTFKDVLKDVGIEAGIEGSEEGFTDLADWAADYIINNDFSEYSQMKTQYGEAYANKYFTNQLVTDVLAGSASGGIMGGGAHALGRHNSLQVADSVMNNGIQQQNLFEAMKEMPEGSTARSLADSKTDVSEMTRTDWANAIESVSAEAGNETEIHEMIKNVLVEDGMSEEEADTAMESWMNDEVTPENVETNAKIEETYQKVLNSSDTVGQRAVAEVNLARSVDLYEQAAQKAQKKSAKQEVKEIKSYARKNSTVPATMDGKSIKLVNFTRLNKTDSAMVGIIDTDGKAKSVPLSDIHISDDTMSEIIIRTMPTESKEAVNTALAMYKGQNVEQYAQLGETFYNQGRIFAETEQRVTDRNSTKNFSDIYRSRFLNPYITVLNGQAESTEYLMKMYNAGITDALAVAQTSGERTQAKLNKEKATHLGEVTDNRTIPADDEWNQIGQRIAETLNINVELTDNTESSENGSFVAAVGRMVINTDASNSYTTIIHELSEFGKAYNPEKMGQLIQSVLKFVQTKEGAKVLNQSLLAYRNTYRQTVEKDKTIEQAGDEYVFDVLGGIFMTEEGMQSFNDFLTSNVPETEAKGIRQTIRAIFDKIVGILKKLVKESRLNVGNKEGYKLAQENLEYVRDLRGQWLDIIGEASRNMQEKSGTGNKKTATKAYSLDSNEDISDKGVQFSIEIAKDEYKKAEDSELYDIAKRIYDGGTVSKKAYYKLSGTLPERLVNDIKNLLNMDVSDYGNEISETSIAHINKRHGSNGNSDHSMEDAHNIARIEYAIENYTQIVEGERSREYRNKDGSYSKTVVMSANIGNDFYYVVEAVPDAKIKTLRVVSAYINKNDTFSDVVVSNDPNRYVQDEHRPNVSSKVSITPETGKSSYSVEVTDTGDKYIKVEDDILKNFDNLDGKEVLNFVKDYIRTNFEKGFYIDDLLVKNTLKGRKEFTSSGQSRLLKKINLDFFADKMRAARNLNEIIGNAKNYHYEMPDHTRKDDITGFVRGNILFEISGRGYKADVLLADSKNNGIIFYDLIEITPENIKEATISPHFEDKSPVTKVDSASMEVAEQQHFEDKSPVTEADATSIVSITPESRKSIEVLEKDLNLKNLSEDEFKVAYEIDETWEEMMREDELKDVASAVEKGRELVSDVKLDKKKIKKMAKEILDENNSTYSLEDLTDNLESVFAYMKDTQDMSYDVLLDVVKDIAKPVMEQSLEIDETQKADLKRMKDYLKGVKIALSPSQRREVEYQYGSYQNFRNALFGTVTISNKGTLMDELWSELVDQSGGRLAMDESDANQPIAFMEMLQSMKPQPKNLLGGDFEKASYEVAMDIFRRYFTLEYDESANAKEKQQLARRVEQIIKARNAYRISTEKNYQKAYVEEKKKANAKKIDAINKLTNAINQLSAEKIKSINIGDTEMELLLEAEKQKYSDKIRKIRQQNIDQVAKIKARNTNSRRNERERRKNTQLKDTLKKSVNGLNKMLKSPTVDEHMKVEMVKPTIGVLEAINMDTGKSRNLREKLGELRRVYERYKNEGVVSQFDYDASTAKMIEDLEKTFEGRNYTELSNEELEAVIDVVKRLRVQIRNANKLIQNEKLHDAYEATREIVEEIKNSGGKAGGLGRKIDDYMDLHLNARSWFKKVSGYREDGALMAIHDQLDAGQMRMMYVQREINQMFSPVLDGKENQAEIKKLTSAKESDLVDIGIVDRQGNPVKVTREMRLSLIMHNMNKGNMQHVLGRGITIPDLKLYNKGKIAEAYARGKTYRYTKYETAVHAARTGNFAELEMERSRAVKTIEQLEQDLSPYEKKFLSIAKEFFHKYSGDVVNEVSQELKGYAVARVNNYFPINTDENFTRREFAGLIKDGTIEGQGFLKERVNANNPIYLEGITNVILRQTDSISRYAGLAIPVRNWQMLANTNLKDGYGMDESISSAIKEVWGIKNHEWLENLLKDIQGSNRREQRTLDGIFDALRSKFAGATLELNPSVAIKQAASYPTAAAVLGAKPLLKATKDLGKGFRRIGIEELEKINPLLWYRNQGNATQELGDIKSKKGFGGSLPRMLNWISNIDAATVRTLEYASAYYVDYNYKNLEKGSREYWEQVSKVFTQVVQQTQPNYTPMQQAEIIRNPNRFLKQMFMFKTQPMQNFNILYDAIGEYKAAIRNKDREWRKRAGRQVARAISSQITSQLVFNLMTVAANLVLHKWYKYKDEAGEWSWGKFLESMGLGMIDAFSGILVGGSELETILSSVLAGQTYYDISVPSLDTMNSLVESINYLKSTSDSESRTKQILKISTTIGEIFGVPVGNIENIVNSTVLYTTDIFEGEGIGNSENILSGTKFKSRDMYNAMYEAVKEGDMDRYDKILDNYIEKVATVDDPEEAAGKGVEQRIGDDYMSEEITEEEARKMLSIMEYSDEEIDNKIKGWNYKAETGQTYSKYARLKDYTAELIENPADMEATQKAQDEVKNLIKEAKDKAKTSKEKTKAASKVKTGIGSSLTNTYKDKFLDLKEQKKLGEATNMQAALIKIFMAAGYSHADALKKIQDWKREE